MEISLDKVHKMLDWLKKKIELETAVENSRLRIVKRGEVYRCHLGVGIGSEMQKSRPCVIVSNEISNIKSSNVTIVPITHDRSTLPCVVNIESIYDSDKSLLLDGQANAANIVTVSKARLGGYICTLRKNEMKNIDRAIAVSLGIISHYKAVKDKLDDKLCYLEKIKRERNAAQDKLEKIRELLLSNDNELIIQEIKDYII